MKQYDTKIAIQFKKERLKMKCQTEVFHNMELNVCLIIIINIGTKSLSKRASPSIHGEYIDDPVCIWFGKLLAFTKMQKKGKRP